MRKKSKMRRRDQGLQSCLLRIEPTKLLGALEHKLERPMMMLPEPVERTRVVLPGAPPMNSRAENSGYADWEIDKKTHRYV